MLIAQLSDLHLGLPGRLLGGRVDTAAVSGNPWAFFPLGV